MIPRLDFAVERLSVRARFWRQLRMGEGAGRLVPLNRWTECHAVFVDAL
jgi:hypothetical protein